MFCMIKDKTESSFIRSMKVGYVKYKRSIRVCIVEFDVEHFRDTLFLDYMISFTERLSTAVIKRRAEYLAGRIAAQRLLKEEGVICPVGMQSDRSPHWPSGWTGSITHTDKYAISIIAPKSEGIFLGVDMEKLNPRVIKNTAEIFLTSAEKINIEITGIESHIAFLIAFSAKESLFKALYPLTGNYFGFDAARISAIEKNHKFLLWNYWYHYPIIFLLEANIEVVIRYIMIISSH
ncbi:4'-phosphopantetheinyl transferase [Enterobacteriaceae bacterium LUAb1]